MSYGVIQSCHCTDVFFKDHRNIQQYENSLLQIITDSVIVQVIQIIGFNYVHNMKYFITLQQYSALSGLMWSEGNFSTLCFDFCFCHLHIKDVSKVGPVLCKLLARILSQVLYLVSIPS